jgi:hypothetical protein
MRAIATVLSERVHFKNAGFLLPQEREDHHQSKLSTDEAKDELFSYWVL